MGSDALYANPGLAARMGETSGLVFDSAGEKRLYIAGDAVWAPLMSTVWSVTNPR